MNWKREIDVIGLGSDTTRITATAMNMNEFEITQSINSWIGD